jgi:hypothetical protein
VPVDPNKRRVSILYTADDGLNYQLVTRDNHARAVNATPGNESDPAMPVRWVPRHVYGKQIVAGRDIKVKLDIPREDHPLWTGVANTFTLNGFPGTFEVTGRVGERRTIPAPPYDGNPNPPNERVTMGYTSDHQGLPFAILTTRAHAAAVGGGAPVAGARPYPKVWTPRQYGLAAVDTAGSDQKATLVEPNPNAAIWDVDTTFIYTIPGLGDFRTTGRIAEKRPRPAPPFIP